VAKKKKKKKKKREKKGKKGRREQPRGICGRAALTSGEIAMRSGTSCRCVFDLVL